MEREMFEKEAHRLRPLLVRYANSYLHDDAESEDVVQDSLLKLWFFRQNIDSTRKIDAIAHVITGRLSINRLRNRYKILPIEHVEIEEKSTIPGINDSDASTILDLIETLPNVEQAVMRLKHIDCMETEDIARLIDSTPAAVRTALSRARKKLREKFLSQ